MRQSNQIDLRTESGARTVTVLPGEAVKYVINTQQSRIGAGSGGAGLWNYIRGIIISCSVRIVNAGGAEGQQPMWADQYPKAISSISLNGAMWGLLIDPTFVNGMVAKHVIEYVGLGFRQYGIRRQPLPQVNGTYTKPFEIYIPFSQWWNPWPDHFAKYLGWMDDYELEIFVAKDALALGGNSNTILDVTFHASLDMIPMSEILIPPELAYRRYESTAGASSTGPNLTNVGTSGSLQGVEDASRLVGMFFSHEVDGFNGSGTANQISTITLPWRDQAQTLFADHFFLRWLDTTRRYPKTGINITNDVNTNLIDTATPYHYPFEIDGPANDPDAWYTPLVWPQVGGLISQFQKVKGNYPLDMTFSAAQTNVFRTYTAELKQYNLQKCSEMIAACGVDPAGVQMVPKLGRKNVKPIDPSKLWCFPRSLIAGGG